MTIESHSCDADGAQSVGTQNRIRNLVRLHYYRNRHLTSLHDDDDLFQDAWIQFNSSEKDASQRSTSDSDQEDSSDIDQVSQEQRLRQAVHKAAERAFGKLRKRRSRGTATETTLEFEPADCLPDFTLVIDLRNQIESLPRDERLVIELLRCGYDGNEIAKLLDLSAQAVSRRKRKAISRLRRILNEPDGRWRSQSPAAE